MFCHHWSVLPSLTRLVRCFRRSRQSFSSFHFLTIKFLFRAKRVTNISIFLFPCNCINAEDITANCWKRAIIIIRRILVVSDPFWKLQLPAKIYQAARAARTFFVPKSSSHWSPTVHYTSHQLGWLASCNTTLKVVLAHWSSPAHVIRPLVLLGSELPWVINNSMLSTMILTSGKHNTECWSWKE